MTIITPDAARAQLRVGKSVTDQQLTELAEAAEALVADELGRQALVDQIHGWPSAERVPANVRHAIKLVLVDLHENRCTPLADMTGVQILIGRHKKLSIG